MEHCLIVLSVSAPDDRGYVDVICCDGNNNDTVNWTSIACMTQSTMGAGVVQGAYIYRAFTRYPE